MICNWCEENYSTSEIEEIKEEVICKNCYPFVFDGIKENKNGNILVLKIDALTFVKLLHKKGKQYNYIDFDPPYMDPDDPIFMKRVKVDSKHAKLNQNASHTRILARWKREKVMKYMRLMLKPKKGYIGHWHTMESELPSSDRGCKHVWVKDEMFGIGGRGCVNNGEYFFLEGPKVPIVETRMMGFFVYESAETKNNGIEIIRACAKPTEIFERVLRHAGIETELKGHRDFSILNPFTGAGRIIRAALKYQEGVTIDACDLDPKNELLGIWSEYMDHESMLKFFPMEKQKPKHDDLAMILESDAYKKSVNEQTPEFEFEPEEDEEEEIDYDSDWFGSKEEAEEHEKSIIAGNLGMTLEEYEKNGLSEPEEEKKKDKSPISDLFD